MAKSVNTNNKSMYCRCCLTQENLRSLEKPQLYHGKMENYRKMITKCFTIEVLLDENWICSSCVNRLRACCSFRRCIVSAKKYLEKHLDSVESTSQNKEEQNNSYQNNHNVYEDFSYSQIINDELSSNAPTTQDSSHLQRFVDLTQEYDVTVKNISNVEKYNPSMHLNYDDNQPLNDSNLSNNYFNESSFIKPIQDVSCFTNDTDSIPPKSTNDKLDYNKDMNINAVSSVGDESHQDDGAVASDGFESSSDEDDKFFGCLDDPKPVTGHTDNHYKHPPYILNSTDRVCEICNKEFSFYKELLQHMHGHYPNHICDVCGKVCATHRSLISHSLVHKDTKFSCQECEKTFKSKSNLKKHVIVKHRGERIYFKCYVCKESLHSYNERLKHLSEKHGREDKMYKCQQCTCKYRLGSQLRTHVRKVHLQEKNHVCSECGAAFFRKGCLNKHLIKHEGQKNFNCNICNKLFSRKDILKQHMKCHADDKKNYLLTPVQQTAKEYCISDNRYQTIQ